MQKFSKSILILILCAILLSSCSLSEPVETSSVDITSEPTTEVPVSTETICFTEATTATMEPEPMGIPSAPIINSDVLVEETEPEEYQLQYAHVQTNDGIKGRSKGYKYFIVVNVPENVVTVYEKDDDGIYSIAVKAMTCATGGATPKSGTYYLKSKRSYVWHGLFGGVYGQYCTVITHTAILFHSVPYKKYGKADKLKVEEFDKLGTKSSMGCIRLQVADCKWIYENKNKIEGVKFVKTGYTPLGKPGTLKISEISECYGWDPTDPDPNSPWIEYKQNHTIQVPDYTGKLIDTVIEETSEFGLFGSICSYVYNTDTPVGTVLRQTINPGKTVPYASYIQFEVSAGNEKKPDKSTLVVKQEPAEVGKKTSTKSSTDTTDTPIE